jgi:glycosyltransferase involved in cell wall biosynthesis
MGVKVSVVIPVVGSDAGDDHFDACVRSLLEQTLPTDEYEVIFADDGTDRRARLDAVAAARANVRVLHLERSGTPMRGRNVGLSVARGDYVYLLDQTDRLTPEALERMHHMAAETGADVLIGRLVQADRAPTQAFAGNREQAHLTRDRLLSLLTPHKLIRREFAETQWLTFPDLPGELSEHAFTLRAYLSAERIAVLADTVCCHLGPERRPAADPEAYADGVRSILDIIDDFVPPGERRDRLYAHWFRTCVLRRLGGRRLLSATAQEREALFAEFHDLIVERFPPRLDTLLPVHARARAVLARGRMLDRLVGLAEGAKGTALWAELGEVRWEGDELTIELTAEVVRGDGSPMYFRPSGGRTLWLPPDMSGGPLLPPHLADITEAVRAAELSIYLRHSETGETYVLPGTCEMRRTREQDLLRLRGHTRVRLDVRTAALGAPLPPGLWEVHAGMHTGAHRVHARVRATGSPFDCVGALSERRLIVPCPSERGDLCVCVEPRSFADSIALVSAGARIARRDGHVFVVLPVPYVPPSGGPPMELLFGSADVRARQVSAPALVEPGMPGRLAGQLVAKIPVRRLPVSGCLGPGTWTPYLRIDDKDVELRFLMDVRRTGRLRLVPAATTPLASPLARMATRFPGARRAALLARAIRARYAVN